MLDGLFEGQVLERVQCVVVNEDADGPLRREQVCKAIDRAHQGWSGELTSVRIDDLSIY